MKMSRKLQSDSAGPVWGLILGMFLVVAGIGIWIYVKSSEPGGSLDDSFAMAAMLAAPFWLSMPAVKSGTDADSPTVGCQDSKRQGPSR